MASNSDVPTLESVHPSIANQMLATLYGQCIGDTLGLLTEFLPKSDAAQFYGKNPKDLRYDQKVSDPHRDNWAVGDWTDDSDQMILILLSLLYHRGEVVRTDFAKRMKRWMHKGFPELGDRAGFGIGATTSAVLKHPNFETTPEKVAEQCWVLSRCYLAPNGGVMRTSILGMHDWTNMEKVIENAVCICKTTHFDPRCQASVVAVCTCISLMLRHTMENKDCKKPKKLDINQLIKESYGFACTVLETDEQKQELWKCMSCKKIKELQLCEGGKIGYTYKCMGCGFWALKQDNFKKAMIEVVMEGGDADTNGAVAGALLACKVGLEAIPDHWINDLKHKSYLLDLHQRFLKLQSEMHLPVEDRTKNDDLSIENLDKLASGDEKMEEKE